MSIPNFQVFMRPVLKAFEVTEKISTLSAIEDIVIKEMKLSDEEAREMLKSERSTVVHSRCHWASYYLSQAGLLTKPQRGMFQITDAGRDALKSNKEINVTFLRQYPDFVDFMARSQAKEVKDEKNSCKPEAQEDPESRISENISEIKNQLANDLLERLKQIPWRKFEFVVMDFMEKLGYGEGKVTQASHDGGIDGIIYEDKLHLHKVLLQAKRFNNTTVGRDHVSSFMGVLKKQASYGVLITTGRFTKEALEMADSSVRLISGEELARLMIDANVGVQTKAIYTIKMIDEDYFD